MLYGYPWMSFSINLFWWQSVWVVVLIFLNRISINDEFLMYVPNFFIYRIFYVVCFLKIHCKCTSTHSMIHHICFVAGTWADSDNLVYNVYFDGSFDIYCFCPAVICEQYDLCTKTYMDISIYPLFYLKMQLYIFIAKNSPLIPICS